jgi:hypothetical protein
MVRASTHPTLSEPLRRALVKRFKDTMKLIEVG